jgi:casein kinase 1
MHTPLRIRTPAIERDEVEDILNDLTKLNLDGRQILGNKTNTDEATRKTQADANKGNPMQKEIIEISSDSDANLSIPPPFMMPKAARLVKLTVMVSDATNNLALSDVVCEFVEVLRSNSSKTLTKEASHFLDMLHKQLADPSVFVTPLRYVLPLLSDLDCKSSCRYRNSRQKSDRQQAGEKEPSHVKLGIVARLRREVATAKSNKEMATMILDFGKVTNRSTGRTITKV